MSPLLDRLRKVGGIPVDLPGKPRNSECASLYRTVLILGTGDCHGPEINRVLKVLRSTFVESIWPDKYREFVEQANSEEATIAEAQYGEFPAGSNATKEDRARNRGVVLIERLQRPEETDRKIREDELKHKAKAVAQNLPPLFGKALETIPNEGDRCILSRVTFSTDGRPVRTFEDSFVHPEIVAQLMPGYEIPDKYVRYVGERIYEEAIKSNLFTPGAPGSDVTICGNPEKPHQDPLGRLRQIMLNVTEEVDNSKDAINRQVGFHGQEATDRWRATSDAKGGIYLCYDPPGNFLGWLEALDITAWFTDE